MRAKHDIGRERSERKKFSTETGKAPGPLWTGGRVEPELPGASP